ncbi:hypothetical protein Tco_0831580 [Tanacetum coccineum]
MGDQDRRLKLMEYQIGHQVGKVGSSNFGESDVDEVSNLGMKSIEDEEVSLVDGVLEGALGALALVDVKDVDNGDE